MSIIDSIRLSGTTYQIQVTVDAALDSGSTNPVANSAITTALDNKVNVVDNEVPDYNVTSQITYQGGYPSQSETASTWDDASMFTLKYNYIRISEANYTTTAAVIDPSGNITTGRTTIEESIGNPLPDYIDMSFSLDDNAYRFTAKEGYRIAHLDIYNDKWATWGYIREERVDTVFEGGQSADVIKDVIEPALINKQDKLVAGENITISGNVISSTGGDGKTLVAGRGIEITTADTANTISFDLPISAGTGYQSIAEGNALSANGFRSHAEGTNTVANGAVAHAEGNATQALGTNSHSEGNNTSAMTSYSHAEGYYTVANNQSEHASGQYNVSSTASTTFGNSGNTLFSVGNGTTSSSRHNAFEIRQNGDIYLSSGGTDIKLQDHLGGGGSTYTAGRGISIANNAISVSLPISAGTGYQSIAEGNSTTARGNYSHAEGSYTTASTDVSHAEGNYTTANGPSSHAEGDSTTANGINSHAEGLYTVANNQSEHASGQYNVSNSASIYFGNSGNTLFSVGNGTDDDARHNAFEIRQNGDIYISSGNTDIKLQDHLGGSSITVDTALDSGSTNPVANSAITTAIDDKQDTLVSGTNIKTINNESILGSGNIDIQGGGKAIEAGRGISITTGETADTVSFNLPISAGTGTNSLIVGYNSTDSFWKPISSGKYSIAHGTKCSALNDNTIATGYYNTANANYSIAQGYHTTTYGGSSHSEGWDSVTRASYSHAEGNNCITNGESSHAEGIFTNTSNKGEHSEGWYNVSSKASNTFGDSGNTLFSVGNGTADNARHNAFEIRQNGDIYLTKDGQDVKLQDQLGGGGSSYSAGTGIDITNDVISVTGKADTSAVTEVSDALTAHTANTTVHITAAEKTSWNGAVTDIATVSGQVSTNTTNIATVSAATTANTTALGGLSLIKLTQAEYDALSPNYDSNTLYVIVN